MYETFFVDAKLIRLLFTLFWLREGSAFAIFLGISGKSAKINKNRNEIAEKKGKMTKYMLTKYVSTDMITSKGICKGIQLLQREYKCIFGV